MSVKSTLAYLLVGLNCLVAATPAWGADNFPNKPIRVIVAYPPGGSTDIIARILAQKLTDRFGQTMLVDNRAGAAGMIGATLAAQSTADGYTLLLSDTPFVVNPSVFAKVSYDPVKDFTPIVMVAQSPLMLVVNASVPAQTLHGSSTGDTADLFVRPEELRIVEPGGAVAIGGTIAAQVYRGDHIDLHVDVPEAQAGRILIRVPGHDALSRWPVGTRIGIALAGNAVTVFARHSTI